MNHPRGVQYYSYEDMALVVRAAYNALQPLADLHDPSVCRLELLVQNEYDRDIAEAMLYFWEHEDWPILPGLLPVHLAFRLLFAEWYFLESHCWHPELQDDDLRAMLICASAITDLWHQSALMWLCSTFCIDERLKMGDYPPVFDVEKVPILLELVRKFSS